MNPGHMTRPDRKENAVQSALMTAFLAGSPFVAYAAGRWASARLSRAARLQQAALGQVPATLLETAPRRSGPGAGMVPGTPARWRAPDGQLRTGLVPAPSGAAAGSAVRVWVDQEGNLADPPMQQPAIADRTELAEGLAATGFAAALAATGRLARRHADRRRLAA